MLDCFYDEFIITGHIEEGTTSPRVAEFNQRFIAEGVLGPKEKRARGSDTRASLIRNQLQMQFYSKIKNKIKNVKRSSFGSTPLILAAQSPEVRKLTK